MSYPIWRKALAAKAKYFHRLEFNYQVRAATIKSARPQSQEAFTLMDLASACQQTAEALELVEAEILAATETT